ncbi:MAG: VWA domain-containing protein, partial [Vicinamibacterales bacterium]
MTARTVVVAASLAAFTLLPDPVRLQAQRIVPPGPVHATPATPAPTPVTIRINVIVTDPRGRPLVDLKPADFQLEDNGVAQTLASVELRAPAAGATAAVTPIVTEDDERTAAQDVANRVFAVFLDEFNVSAGVNSARVREAAQRFIAESVRPGDLLYVLKPMDPVTGFRLTRDRTGALATIAAFEGRKGDYAPRTAFEKQFIGRTPAVVDGARAQIVTTGLREMIMAMGELRPARGAVVLISEGFSATAASERRRLPDWQGLARAASHFNLPIYTFDPGDPLPAPAPDAPPAETTADRGASTLQSLARQTGGAAVEDARGLESGLAKVSRDLDGYYVLTYQPSQATDGRFHPIAVRTARKGAQVRVPSGYWSPLSSEWRTWLDREKTAAPAAPVRALKRSRLIETWYGFERGADGTMALMFTWEPTAIGNGLRSRPQVVELKVSTTQGTSLFEREVTASSGPNDDTTDRALVPVPAGRLQIDLRIRGADGVVIDTGAQDVEVPITRGSGPVLLQPQIVRARTVREFRALSADPTAAPTPVRVFSRSERLLVRVPAYNPDGAAVTASVSVSNVKGATIRTLTPLAYDGSAP